MQTNIGFCSVNKQKFYFELKKPKQEHNGFYVTE